VAISGSRDGMASQQLQWGNFSGVKRYVSMYGIAVLANQRCFIEAGAILSIFGHRQSRVARGARDLYEPQGTGLKWVNHSFNIASPTETIVGPMKIPSRPKV
jgi:hypothetical protein